MIETVKPAPTETIGAKRGERKRAEILSAARSLFLQHGYLGVSMDQVAAVAHVSKQTVYKHFGDKSSLFLDLLTADMASADDRVSALGDAIPESADLPHDLRAFARAYITSVMRPELMRMRRVAIAEAERFPELAKTWYANGPEHAYATFANWFRRLHQRGVLDVPDALLAAQHFNWLILAVPVNEAMAAPIDDSTPDDHVLHRYADEGVRVFLAAYTNPRNSTSTTDEQAGPSGDMQ